MHTTFLFHRRLSPTMAATCDYTSSADKNQQYEIVKRIFVCADVEVAYYWHIQRLAVYGFINFYKFMMKRQIPLEIIDLSAFWVTEILTANRLLSNTAKETDFLNSLPFAIH